MNFDEVRAEFECLPTIPPTEVTLAFIDKVLTVRNTPPVYRSDFAEIISDLITSLTDNYASVTHEQTLKIIEWVGENWDESDLGYIDLLISIVANTEVLPARAFLKSKLRGATGTQVKSMLIDMDKELSGYE